MKALLIVTMLLGSTSGAQSPFEYSVGTGMFRCTCFADNVEVKADGSDQKIPTGSYWDTASIRVVDNSTVEIITKKAGKTMFTETDTVSPDGYTLTQHVKDTTEAEAVTVESLNRRVGKRTDGTHAISGSWKAYKVVHFKNSSMIKYKCTAEGFSAETPLGEKFEAKFDGRFYAVADDPGHT